MKIKNDKYYTPTDLAKRLIDKTFNLLDDVTEIIEPSAGGGSFSEQLDCVAYDIEPEHKDVIQQDFLELDLGYKKGRLIIGNPPFGVRMSLATKFYNKAVELGDYIAFILPISQYNKTVKLYKFDLLSSEDLGLIEYSGRKLHCCFNIYKRPSGELNKIKKLDTNIVKICDRRSKNFFDFEYDMIIRGWGANSGEELLDDSCTNSIKLYFPDRSLVEYNKNIIRNYDFHKGKNYITSKCISRLEICELLKNNIPIENDYIKPIIYSNKNGIIKMARSGDKYFDDFEYDFLICRWGNIGVEHNEVRTTSMKIKIIDRTKIDYYKNILINYDYSQFKSLCAPNVNRLDFWNIIKKHLVIK